MSLARIPSGANKLAEAILFKRIDEKDQIKIITLLLLSQSQVAYEDLFPCLKEIVETTNDRHVMFDAIHAMAYWLKCIFLLVIFYCHYNLCLLLSCSPLHHHNYHHHYHHLFYNNY